VRHLLSHMAGLTRQAPIDNTYPSWDDHVASIGDTWLRFPVGTRYAYSDIGIDLVGRVLEVATGEPFPRFVARRVLEPLGMERATFDVAEITADRDRCVGHVQGEEQQITGMVPAGSLYASARDLGAFLRFVIDGGVVAHRRVLSAELLEQWSTTPFPAPGQVEGYALGLRTKRTACGIARGHAGSGFGFFADLWWLQASGEGGAVVVSSQELDRKRHAIEGSGGIPDYTFMLPQGLQLHMDVKFPLNNYLRFLDATSDVERERCRKDFLKDVRMRLKEVTSRGYAEAAGNTVDCVLLFIPNEQVYGFIHEHDRTVLDDALRQKVVFCSPLTLFAVLAVVRQAVDNFRLSQTSHEILELLGGFQKQWEKFVEQMDKVGRAVKTVDSAFEELRGTRARQLDRQLDRIDALRQRQALEAGDDDGGVLPFAIEA
jgi:hypothetical protein